MARQHIGNMSDPQIPAALGSVVAGVKALHNFFPRPAAPPGQSGHAGSGQREDGRDCRESRQATLGQSSFAKTSSLQRRRGPSRRLPARPQYGISQGGTNPYLVEDVGPNDFATIYNVLPLWNASTPIDGTGQTLPSPEPAILMWGNLSQLGRSGPTAITMLLTFRNFFGLAHQQRGQHAFARLRRQPAAHGLHRSTGYGNRSSSLQLSDDLVENTLDVEWSGSIAKNAQIVLVSSYVPSTIDPTMDSLDSESYIVDNIDNPSSPVNGARIMNVSYGECELGNGTAGNVEYYNLWQRAAAEGIAVFVAAGDSGSASCDDGNYVAESGLTVSGLASTPYNTAVGGTDFNWCNPDTAFTYGVRGLAVLELKTTAPPQFQRHRYIPETPWNKSCANPLTLKWVQDAANYYLRHFQLGH